MKFVAALTMLALKAPAKPLSPETTTTNMFFSGRVTSSGCRISPVSGSMISARRFSDCSTPSIIVTYGRDDIIRSCARRSFAAATIFMALVIWRVFLVLRMRLLKSRTFAMPLSVLLGRGYLCRLMFGEEILLVLVDRILQAAAQIVVNRFL